MADPIWQTARYHADLVQIADDGRQIQTIVAGQRRVSAIGDAKLQPLVVIEAGLGGVAEEHVLVAQLIASFARVLRYSRTGYGDSDLGTYEGPLDARVRAEELSLLLGTIGLPPPYIIIAHSYGGIIARTFLQQRNEGDIVGMVLVECLPHFQAVKELPATNIMPTLRGGGSEEDRRKADGLFHNMLLTPEQDDATLAAKKKMEEKKAVEKDFFATDESVAFINEAQGAFITTISGSLVTDIDFTSRPLGDGRVSIVLGNFPRDFEALIAYATFHGYGDNTIHRKAKEILANAEKTNWPLQKSHTSLTAGESRVRVADGTGRTHNLQLTRPDIIAEEVKWVMEGTWDLKTHAYWPSPQ